ncbi:YusW family protein [Halobacillus seohaensis]|uniref:YusW family protein n=1 Tax=Halobacillus seohaensis TaxID=447421 RepID=A0ABW2EIT8_9BACI
MKWKLMHLILLMSSFMILTACANQNNQQEALDLEPMDTTPTEIDYTENEENNLNFTSFDLEVDYVDRLSYEVEYDLNRNLASIEDLDNQKFTDSEAFNQLSTNFHKFSFDENTPEDEVIDEVIQTFELNPTYKEFELDIEFIDGTTKEYED